MRIAVSASRAAARIAVAASRAAAMLAVSTVPVAHASDRPARVAVEVGGGLLGGATGVLTVGILSAGVCALTDAGNRSFGCIVPTVAGGYVGGAVGVPLGVWAAGEAMGGNGGFGWALLGSLSGTTIAASTILLADVDEGSVLWWTLLVTLPLTGAIVGYELSSDDLGPRTVTAAWSIAF